MALTVSANKNWSDYEATSSTSLAITNGALTALSLTISTGKAYVAGDDIALVPTAAKIPMMLVGTVTSYDAGSGALVANCTRIESQISSWDLVSASSNTVGTGAKTFITYNNKSSLLAASDAIMVGRRSTNGGNRMVGTVTSYNNADGTLVMNCTSTIGSGTNQTDWIIVSSGTFSAWKIVPSPITNITLTGNAVLTFDQEPSYPIGSLVSLDRGRFHFANASTTTPWVIEMATRNANSSKVLQLENNGKATTSTARIQVATGSGVAGQTIDLSSATYSKIDFPAVEVETGSGTGVYRPWYVLEDGATDRGFLGKNWVSRGYKSNFDTSRSSTVTLTTATPTVITWTSHGLRPGQRVRFTTTGTYSGITTGVDYYVQPANFTTSTFSIATSPIQASLVAVSAQSGTHTCAVLPEFGNGVCGNVLLWNPTTRLLRCGDGTVGNVIPSGAKVRIPNIHFTQEMGRTPIMSAISSATAGNAVTFVVGNVSNIGTATSMTFIINGEEFSGTFSGSTMTTASRASNGSIAANHAQGDTFYAQLGATSTTSNQRGLVDLSDGGILELNGVSFGSVYFLMSGPQDSTLTDVWITGGANIGSTTGNITINGLYNSPWPQTDSGGITIGSILGTLNATKIYGASTALTQNASPQAVLIQNNQNVASLSNIEGFGTMRNGTSALRAVDLTANVFSCILSDLRLVGGRLYLANQSRFEVDGITLAHETNGISNAQVGMNAVAFVNCQYAILRNLTKFGGACRNQVFSTDANCSNIKIHGVTYDCDSNSSAAISALGNNILLANGTFGAPRDGSGTSNGAWALTNSATADTVTVRNCTMTIGDSYGADNGIGETARVFVEQSSGHSMWWRAAGTPFSGNYQEMGPFHTLLDNGTKATGTLFAQFSSKSTRDIYTLNGTAYLNNGGSVFLPVTGDYIILKSYQNIRTVTGFTGAVTPEDVNDANLAFSFELVGAESSFTNTFTALTTANLNTAIAAISGYSDAKGFKLQIKIAAIADSATNQVINLRMFTTNNAATVLPIDYVNYTLTGLSANTTVAAFNGTTEDFYQAGASGTLVVKIPYAFNGTTNNETIKIRCLDCNWDDHTASHNQYDFTRASLQTMDTEVTVNNSATVAAYTTLGTTAKIYDYAKYWGSLRANLLVAKPCAKSGTALDFGSLNVVIDASAAQVFNVSAGTVTIKASAITSGTITTTGTLTTLNGAVMQITYTAGGVTYSYATATVTGYTVGSRVQIYNVTTATEVYNGVPAGASHVINYTDGTTFTHGDTVRVRIAYVSGTTANLPEQYTTTATTLGWTVTDDVQADTVYNLYAINGSTVTEFSADYVNTEANVTVAADWYASRLYAWWCYNLTTSQGIAQFLGGLEAEDSANLLINNSVLNLYLDNTTSTNLKQLDNIRIHRSDSAYPVKSSGGGGMDVVWRNQIFIAETGTSGLTVSEAATLAKLDTLTENVSGLRFTAKALETAPSGGSAPTVVQIRQEMDANSTKLANLDAAISTRASQISVDAIPTTPLLAADSRLNNLDAAISTRLATSGYTVPPTAAANATAVRSELTTELGRIDAAVSSRSTYAGADTAGTTTLLSRVTGSVMLASSYTAPLDATATQAAAAAALTAYDAATGADVSAIPAAPTASAIRSEIDANSTKLATIDSTTKTTLAVSA